MATLIENNKTILQNFVHDVVDGKNLSAADRYLAPNFFHHDLAPGEQTANQTGREGLKRFFAATVFPAFSGFRTAFQHLIAQKDLVAGLWTQSVKQTGRWLGRPPSGREASIGGISIVRVRRNLICEEWEARDTVTLLQTFGVIPKPKPLDPFGGAVSGGVLQQPYSSVRTGAPLAPPLIPTKDVAGGSLSAGGTSGALEALKTPALLFITEVLSGGQTKAIDQLFAPGFVNHDMMDGQRPGREGIKQFTGLFRSAFPEAVVTPDVALAEGDMVVARWTAIGRQGGTFLGVPPRGRSLSVSGITAFRIQGNQIAERWGYWPVAETLQQLGAGSQ